MTTVESKIYLKSISLKNSLSGSIIPCIMFNSYYLENMLLEFSKAISSLYVIKKTISST